MRYRRKEYEPTPAQIKKMRREIRRTWSKTRKLSRGGLLTKYRLPTDATTLVRQVSPELSAMLDTNDIRDENRCDFEDRRYFWRGTRVVVFDAIRNTHPDDIPF